uniref:Uncharacterized protein n=1 Tax=Romanomermis culicivorax TaxID=13658 RepID=A0A915IKE4_ROMCU
MSSCAPPPPPPLQGLLESMINDKNKIVRLKITKTECTGHPAIDVRSFKSSGPLATSCHKNAVIKRKLEALFSSNIIEEKSKINCINVASYDESTNTAIQVTPARSLPNRESLSNSPKTMKDLESRFHFKEVLVSP